MRSQVLRRGRDSRPVATASGITQECRGDAAVPVAAANGGTLL